jgi:hypothetical protein
MSEFFLVVALVLQIQGGKPIGSATGFFYMSNNTLYFVTNRHVVKNESGNIAPESLRIKLHTNPNDATQNTDVEIPLYEKGRAMWHVHKDYMSKKIDLAVIEIDQTTLKKGFVIIAVSA